LSYTNFREDPTTGVLPLEDFNQMHSVFGYIETLNKNENIISTNEDLTIGIMNAMKDKIFTVTSIDNETLTLSNEFNISEYKIGIRVNFFVESDVTISSIKIGDLDAQNLSYPMNMVPNHLYTLVYNETFHPMKSYSITNGFNKVIDKQGEVETHHATVDDFVTNTPRSKDYNEAYNSLHNEIFGNIEDTVATLKTDLVDRKLYNDVIIEFEDITKKNSNLYYQVNKILNEIKHTNIDPELMGKYIELDAISKDIVTSSSKLLVDLKTVYDEISDDTVNTQMAYIKTLNDSIKAFEDDILATVTNNSDVTDWLKTNYDTEKGRSDITLEKFDGTNAVINPVYQDSKDRINDIAVIPTTIENVDDTKVDDIIETKNALVGTSFDRFTLFKFVLEKLNEEFEDLKTHYESQPQLINKFKMFETMDSDIKFPITKRIQALEDYSDILDIDVYFSVELTEDELNNGVVKNGIKLLCPTSITTLSPVNKYLALMVSEKTAYIIGRDMDDDFKQSDIVLFLTEVDNLDASNIIAQVKPKYDVYNNSKYLEHGLPDFSNYPIDNAKLKYFLELILTRVEPNILKDGVYNLLTKNTNIVIDGFSEGDNFGSFLSSEQDAFQFMRKMDGSYSSLVHGQHPNQNYIVPDRFVKNCNGLSFEGTNITGLKDASGPIENAIQISTDTGEKTTLIPSINMYHRNYVVVDSDTQSYGETCSFDTVTYGSADSVSGAEDNFNVFEEGFLSDSKKFTRIPTIKTTGLFDLYANNAIYSLDSKGIISDATVLNSSTDTLRYGCFYIVDSKMYSDLDSNLEIDLSTETTCSSDDIPVVETIPKVFGKLNGKYFISHNGVLYYDQNTIDIPSDSAIVAFKDSIFTFKIAPDNNNTFQYYDTANNEWVEDTSTYRYSMFCTYGTLLNSETNIHVVPVTESLREGAVSIGVCLEEQKKILIIT